MLNLGTNYPDVAAAARWYLEPVDYLSMRFTGVAAASHASMTAAWLTDNRHLDLLAYDDELVRRAGVDGAKLPPLVPPARSSAPVRDDVAADLGLPAGVQVVTGVPDLHAAAIGAGARRPRRGAHGAQHHVVDQPAGAAQEDRHPARDGQHPRRSTGGYLLANNHDTSGLCLQWLRDNMVAPTTGCSATASRPPTVPFDDLTALAAGSPPGAGGVIFTPWLDGRAHPGRRQPRAGRLPQPLARHRPGPTSCGR